jgi:hypothetical protein
MMILTLHELARDTVQPDNATRTPSLPVNRVIE